MSHYLPIDDYRLFIVEPFYIEKLCLTKDSIVAKVISCKHCYFYDKSAKTLTKSSAPALMSLIHLCAVVLSLDGVTGCIVPKRVRSGKNENLSQICANLSQTLFE